MNSPPKTDTLAQDDRPLSGVRVLDIGRLMPSSIATAELAALGAEVIKLELPPVGDYLRVNPPHVHARGDMHLVINRGKKSVCIDLRTEAGQALFERLVKSSDVVVELSKPGGGARLGLSCERMRSLNPRLVHCSITGFGHTGPYSTLGAHGLSADAAAGLLPLERDGHRWVVSEHYVSVGPRASGLYAAIAILGALFKARATGEGTFLDVSQWDSAVSWNYRNLTLMANDAVLAPAYRDLGPKYDVYEAADGSKMLLCVPEPRLWRAFCQAIGRDDLARHATDAAIEYDEDDDLRRVLQAIFATQPANHWIELGMRFGFPLAPVVSSEDLPDDPHVIARGMLRTAAHPLGGDVRLPGHPVKGSIVEMDLSPAPELGQHNDEVLRSLGYSDTEISALIESGAVVQP